MMHKKLLVETNYNITRNIKKGVEPIYKIKAFYSFKDELVKHEPRIGLNITNK